MAPAWLALILLLVVPGLAAAQTPGQPPPFTPPPAAPSQPTPISPPTTPVLPSPIVPPTPLGQVIVNPRTPPPATIPSAPEIVPVVPPAAPPEPSLRPVKALDFRPTVTLFEEYTDNFFRSHDHPTSNFRSSVSPGFLFLLDTGPLTGQFAYTPFAYYDTAIKEANVNHYVAGQLFWQATPRLRLSAADTFTHSDDPSQSDRLNLQRGRQRFDNNLFSVGSDYALLERFGLQNYYRLSLFSNDQDHTTTHTIGAVASAYPTRITTLSLGYEYLHSETTVESTASSTPGTIFTGPANDSSLNGHQVTATVSRDVRKDLTAGITAVYATRDQTIQPGGHDTFNRWSVSFFSNYIVPEKIVLRSSIGVAKLTGTGSSSDEGPLVTSNSDLTYFLGPATLGLRVERGFSETFGQGQNFGVVQTFGVTGSVTYQFTPLLSSTLRGAYRENKFTGQGSGGLVGGNRDDKAVTGGATLTYRILRWLYATLDYTYTDTRSSDSLASYVENRARIGLTASFY